jgi:hypothetical protein
MRFEVHSSRPPQFTLERIRPTAEPPTTLPDGGITPGGFKKDIRNDFSSTDTLM